MFEFFQKKLLDKALGKSKPSKTNAKTKTKSSPVDHRSQSGRALDDAIAKLEKSGSSMDELLSQNEDLLRQAKLEAAKKLTPERRALIEQALRIRQQKEKILDDLDDETRAKLYLTAVRTFMGKK